VAIITAANYPTQQVPQVAPSPTPGPDTQQISGVSPNAFGAGIGLAFQGLGKDFATSGDELAKNAIELQQLKNYDTVNTSFLNGSVEAGQLAAQFKSLTGKDAVEAYPKYQADLLGLRDKYKEGMNPMAARMFDQEFSRRLGFALMDGASHAATEQRKAFVANAQAVQYNTLGDIAQNPTDETRFQSNLATMRNQARTEMVTQGYAVDDPVTLAHVNKVTSEAYERRIFEISKTNPAGASAIFKAHDAEIADPVIREKIQGHIAQGWLQNGSRSDAESILSGGAGGDAALVRKYESEGLAKQLGISPYNIGVGGTDLSSAKLDANGFPQWGGKGDSHAAGAYQFQPDTWAKYAAPLGIHDFSPASQDKVFAAAHAAEGWEPWEPYNKELAAELQSRRSGGGGGGIISSAQAATGLPFEQTPRGKYEGWLKSQGQGDNNQIDPAGKWGYDRWAKAHPEDAAAAPASTATQPIGPGGKTLAQALQEADALVDRRVANGEVGGTTGVPEAQYRETVKTNIRSQYNLSQQATKDTNNLRLYAARASVLQTDQSGDPVYKSLDNFLADDANRQVYYDLDEQGKAVVRNQIAKNATVVPMTPERIERYEQLRDLRIAAPDEFVKLDPLAEDLPPHYKMQLANQIRETNAKADKPETWRTDLNRALGQIKQEGLILNTGIDPTSKTDERSHRFVAALGRELQEFEQEKKRPMNTDEVRKSVAGLMRTAVPWSWTNPLAGSQSGFDVFVPKTFREGFVGKFQSRWGAPPSTQQIVDAYHASDEFKHAAPATGTDEEPNP
jgi:hypothetical protein